MPLTQVSRSQWQASLGSLSCALAAHRVAIEVTGIGLGHQVQAEWLPLIGLSYDAGDDVLAVLAEGIEHFIRRPEQIHVDRDLQWVRSMEVVDAEGNHHIILFREPLSLPAP